ncbi:uncharacterized protein TNCV_2319081 [Trichonephila clavipes]|nr:uncharacterized protein TNCV_2319081 [Trichonephila clavipes]
MPKARSKVSRKRKFYGNRFAKLALNSSNSTSASEAKLSTFDSFHVHEPEFHGSTGNIIINFQALMGIISILCCPECYATGLKLAEDSKEGLCSNLCVACSCGFMTGFTSTPKENKKLSLNTLLVFGLRLIGRGFTAGSSGNMEAVGAFRIFERSLIKRDLQYTEYYGDGDSKGFLQVKDIYGENNVTKLECIGHIQKRVGSRLRKLKKNTKGLGGKGKLTDKFIDKLQNYYGIAIRSNVGCLEKMQSAVIAAFFHCCSSNQNPMHGQCPTGKDSWCKYKQALSDGKVYVDKTAGLSNYVIKPTYLTLCDKELLKKCLHGKTQNNNESFNNVLWSVLPKEIFVHKKTLFLGSYMAVLLYNSGYLGLLPVFNYLGIGIDPTTLKNYMGIDKERIQKLLRQSLPSTKLSRKKQKAKKKSKLAKIEAKEGLSYKYGEF